MQRVGYESPARANYGLFHMDGLLVISSGTFEPDEMPKELRGWEHVSVSRRDRCPTWEEMCLVKRLFWEDEETVLQFHPPRSRYVNVSENCLHLWKQTGVEHPLPPNELI